MATFVITEKYCYEIVEQEDGSINIYKSENDGAGPFPDSDNYGNGSQIGYKNF